MKRLFIACLSVAIIFISFLSIYSIVEAQKSIEAVLTGVCKTKLNEQITIFGSLKDLINPAANLPFVPAECGTDTKGGTSAIPVSYLPLVLLKVYKFIIGIAAYLFLLGLLITGVLIQLRVMSGNVAYERQLNQYFGNAITGLFWVLGAYFVVYIILWIFNADKILTTTPIDI
ncbi:MAG: hypothetical protein ACRCXZ_10120 [Patescibacteria group bacterium]